MRGAVFFDVDGTLVPGTSASRHLAGRLGHAAELGEAEDGYDAGRLDSREWAVVDAHGWAGSTAADIHRHLEDLPLVAGIAEVVAWCRERDLLPVLGTLAWAPVGDYLCGRFGFAGRCGPVPEQVGGRYTGAVAAHLDEDGKRDHAAGVARDLGLTLLDCAAVGDGRSDVPLFASVGFPIAFNATAPLQAMARACVAGDDLRAVLPVLSGWLTIRPM